jgi:outer membrane protein TolC
LAAAAATLALASTSGLPAAAQAVPQLPASAVQTRPQPGVPQQVTLQQAIDIAVAKSPVLAAARANRQIAQIPVNLARTAIFPNISADATTTHSNNASRSIGGTGGVPSQVIGGGFTSTGLNANLRQLIYDGGKVIAQLHQARAAALAGTQTYERNLETVVFNVASAYYVALQDQSATRLAQQVLNQDIVQMKLVQAQLRAGTASRVDLATAELPVAQARVALVRAQGTQATALAAFASALGLDADTAVAPANVANASAPTPQVPVLSYDQAIRRAFLLRPDFLAAQSTVLSSQYNVQVQRSGYYPTLTGNAAYGTNSTSVNGSDFRPGSSIGATLSIPIFDQGITRAQTEQARAQLDLAQAQFSSTRLTVESDVRSAVIGLVTAQAAVAQAQAELAQAQTVLSATQAQYRAGVTTLPLLLNAQVQLTTAQTDQLNAVYGLRQAEQAYVYALGENTAGISP